MVPAKPTVSSAKPSPAFHGTATNSSVRSVTISIKGNDKATPATPASQIRSFAAPGNTTNSCTWRLRLHSNAARPTTSISSFSTTPDEIGYTSPVVWDGMDKLRQEGLTKEIGIAPGPANGFVPDLVQTFENFGHLIDWAMVILNPLEPWPASHSLDAADRFDVKVITRVLDYGGIFYDELKPDHEFKPGDHRAYRPDGWVKRGYDFIERIRPMAEAHNLTPLQYAANWNLSHSAVKAVIPTFVQEPGDNARSIESKIEEMATLPIFDLDPREIETVRELGDNTGCMLLKGASSRHSVSERCDEWPMRPDLMEICKAYDLGTDW